MATSKLVFAQCYRFNSVDKDGVAEKHVMVPGDEVPSFLDKKTVSELKKARVVTQAESADAEDSK